MTVTTKNPYLRGEWKAPAVVTVATDLPVPKRANTDVMRSFLENGLIDSQGNSLAAIDFSAQGSSLSTGDILNLLTKQISTANGQSVKTHINIATARNANVQAQHAEMAEKLKEAWKAQDQADNTANSMNILKWTIFALSLAVLGVVGMMSVVGAIGAVVALPFVLLSVVPASADGKTTVTDAWTKAMADSMMKSCIIDPLKDAMKAHGMDAERVDGMSNEEIVNYCNDHGIKSDRVISRSWEEQQMFTMYMSMACVIATEVGVALIGTGIGAAVAKKTGAMTGGAAITGSIAGGAVTGGATAARIAGKSAASVAKSAAQAAVAALKNLATKASNAGLTASKVEKGARLMNAVAQMGVEGYKIKGAIDKRAAVEAKVDAEMVQCVIDYLQNLIDHDETRLRELLKAWFAPFEEANKIVHTQHKMHENIVAHLGV